MLPDWNKNTPKVHLYKRHSSQAASGRWCPQTFLAHFITLLMIFADGGSGRLFRWSDSVSKWWKSIFGELLNFLKTLDHPDLNFQTTSIKQEDTLPEAVSPSSSSTSESPFPPNQEMECYIISNDGYKSRWIEYINADRYCRYQCKRESSLWFTELQFELLLKSITADPDGLQIFIWKLFI